MASATRKNGSKPSLGSRWTDDLVRMLWMGLGGRTTDLEQYLRRVLPRWEAESPELSLRLRELLAQNPSASGSLTRSVAARPEPAGDFGAVLNPVADSSGDLMRFEMPVRLPLEPVWPTNVAEELQGIVRERRAVSQLAKAGLRPTHTVIFTGPPGVGKTLAARWLARELKLPLAVLNLSAVMSSFLGRTGANLRQVISYASRQPCILLLDEIDAIAKRRDDNSDIGELKRLVTVLLQELDAWPAEGLLVAATNHEQLIDPAVWRRFERRVIFGFPDAAGQAEILARLLGETWAEVAPKTRAGIAAAARYLSPGDLTQIALRAKREAILSEDRLEDRLFGTLSNAIAMLPLAERKRVGHDLKQLNLGQREINRLTGLARETIRELAPS